MSNPNRKQITLKFGPYPRGICYYTIHVFLYKSTVLTNVKPFQLYNLK